MAVGAEKDQISVMQSGEALAEGFYWHAEKLMWGYEDTQKNPEEALRFFRQAVDLGFSDALIRIGQLHEYGKGTPQSTKEAIECYKRAIQAGNFFGYAFIAKLLSRTAYDHRAADFWRRFFQALRSNPEPTFLADTPGGLLHNYLASQLRLGAEPEHLDVIRQHWNDVVAHHQSLLEHAVSDAQLERLEAIGNWMKSHL